MNLRSRQVGSWSLNAYALICPDTRHSVLVDPGAEPDKLQKILEGTRPKAILITHSHPDHVGALEFMQKHLAVPVMAHPGTEAQCSPVKADRWLKHGDALPVGRHLLRVYHTPGHTDDQVCFAIENDNTIIVGDTLFEGGPGKTWSAQGFKQTLNTLRHTVLGWSDDAICYPGHGPHFCLGEIRADIEKFLQKDHGNFFGDATWGM